jgi:hypothetical protein
MGLRKVYATQSLADIIWHYMVYLEARLLTDSNAKEFAPEATTLIDEVESTWQGQRSKWRAEVSAQARVDYANEQLDQQTLRFSRVLLSQEGVDLDAEHPRYKRYFTSSPSRVTRLALEPQIKVMRPWLESIRTEPELAVQSFAALLTSLIEQGEEALHHQDQATAARKDHRVREVTNLVKKINDTCQKIHGLLKAKAPGLNMPADWADGFFYSPRNASAPDAASLFQDALYGICKARGVELSDNSSDFIDKTKDEELLQQWISRALRAKTEEDIFTVVSGQ